jgi:signal transduction histidine kinase
MILYLPVYRNFSSRLVKRSLSAMPTSSIPLAALSDSQHSAVLQQVVNNTQAGLLLARPVRNEQGQIIDFQYVLTNEYNARITGRSVAEMTGALVNDLFPGWQDSDLFRQYVAVVETGKSQRFTFPYEAYGMKGWFDGTFSLVDDCILYTYVDVTSLKEAELAQQQQAELLERVMNATLTGIAVHEPVHNEAGELIDFRLTQLNQMAADILGGSIQNIQNQLLSRYFPGVQDTPLFEKYRRVIKTGKPTRVELPRNNRWFELSVNRFGNGLVVVVQDVTYMHRHREQLEQANHELKRSNESLNSFAYIASHDLQEPLRKISSFADILHTRHAGQFDAETTDIIRRINGSAERMRLLISDLLTYSQVDVHQDSFSPVNLTALLRELTEEELWTAIHKSKAELHLTDLPTLKANPVQMRQLFQNLISNAIKFSQNDRIPVITINCRSLSRAEIPAGLLAPSSADKLKAVGTNFVEITVTDNGIGFDEKYVARIFQVFQRLNGRTQYSGSGIGLAICQKIVEHHNGAITANSTPGEGSTFRVYLPV